MPREKRDYGAGTIDQRGENTWRLRCRIGDKRFAKTVKGTKTPAIKKLRELLNAGDKGRHVAPDSMTAAAWIDHWISIGAPGQKKKKKDSGARTVERYAELLRIHVKPTLGEKKLQGLQSTDIDKLYASLDERGLSDATALHVRRVFAACLAAAVRKKLLVSNPIDDVETVPDPDEFEHEALDDDQLRTLVKGFRSSRRCSGLRPVVHRLPPQRGSGSTVD
jgi:integrase